jgi:uridine kinase
MEGMIEVFCRNTDRRFLVPCGTDLKGVLRFAQVENHESVLGALVNNKVQSMNYKVYTPREIEYFDYNSSYGRRMYALSLMFVLYKATKDLYPQYEICIQHSMSDGYYVEFENADVDIEFVMEALRNRMKEIIASDIKFERELVPISKAVEMFRKVGMNEKADLLSVSKRLYASVDVLGGTINSFFYDLVPSTSYLKVFDLYKYNKGIILQLPTKNRKESDKIFSVFQEHKQWLKVLNTPFVSDLNKVVSFKKENELIQVSEALHEKKYAQIADEINKREERVKLVLLAGPSSSGKTTSCRRISTQLSVLGYNPIQISLDDYFVNREFTPKDENGEYDFECFEALDVDYFVYQMKELIKGNEVSLPRFNFLTGQREETLQVLKMQENSILIIEGIHALNPKLTEEIEDKYKYKVFVSALTQVALDKHNLISTSDNRLIRRIVRDNNYRGYSAEDTIMRWDSVRSGEEKHIFPYQENADIIFNSSLLYEIGLLKPIVEPLLMEVGQNSPAYAEAKRLQTFLANFKSFHSDFIPPTSIMREFLGGSSFNY